MALKCQGQKWCSEGKCVVIFYAMNNFGIIDFSLFMIDA